MEQNRRLAAFCAEQQIICLTNQSMKDYTTFRIGGIAELILKPASVQELCLVMGFCNRLGVTPLLLGNGSDLLVCDEGISRPVVQIGEKFSGMWIEKETEIICDAGASLGRLCRFALEHSLTGLEFAYGIPGNVGGAVYMNAGAYGGEMKDAVVAVTHVTPQGEVERRDGQACEFSYRHSSYAENACAIAQVRVALRKGEHGAIKARMDELMTRRKTKQPLEYPSAGSTFKRPAGSYASALIDACGLKGRRVGGAMVSEKHAGFLVNYKDATCAEVLELIALVQREVREKTGFQLECEIKQISG